MKGIAITVHPEISESERFPLLTDSGRRLLNAMRQHASAPIWNWPNGEQLDAKGLEQVRTFAARLQSGPVFDLGRLPDWLGEYVDFCLEEVPFYRRRSPPGSPFREIPSCSREDLATRVWEFVPDSQPLDHLIVFSSSGTTGHPARLPTHPVTAACGIPLLEHAMAMASQAGTTGGQTGGWGRALAMPQQNSNWGIANALPQPPTLATPLTSLGRTDFRFPRGPESVALANVAAYRGAYTTAIVIAYLEEAGCIRVNLRDEDWRAPGDCRRYLDRWSAPVMLGDPLAFAALEQVAFDRPPQVMISSIMHLSDSFAQKLSARYGCPVLDLYALTEAGIVALRVQHGHVVLPPDLYVEILDEFDEPCASGTRGEITLTGGRNPFGPLLRYRTGDFGALEWHGGQRIIVGLEGRPPVSFATDSGHVIHSMEVSRLLRQFPLVQYQLYQDADGGFRFGYRGGVNVDDLQTALMELLEQPRSLMVEQIRSPVGSRRKIHEYRSDFKIPSQAAEL